MGEKKKRGEKKVESKGRDRGSLPFPKTSTEPAALLVVAVAV